MVSDVVVREKEIVVNVRGPTGYLVADRVYENIITLNLLCMLSRGFGGPERQITSVDGIVRTLVRIIDLPNMCNIRAGTGTTTPSANDNDVPNFVEIIVPTATMVKVDNAYEIRFYGAPTVNINTFGLQQLVHFEYPTTSVDTRTYLYTRVLAPIPAGTSFMYAMRIPHPLNANFSAFLYGWFTRGTPAMMDMDGVVRSVQGRYPHASRASFILVSNADVDDSVDRATVPSYTLLPASAGFAVGSRQGIVSVSASFMATTTYTIRLIGLVKDLIDTGGTLRRFLLALRMLPTPVTLAPGERRGITINLITRM
ncbi:MAG: hypothetical protein QXQ90_10055 [Desulfurococcaceae archaeon]